MTLPISSGVCAPAMAPVKPPAYRRYPRALADLEDIGRDIGGDMLARKGPEGSTPCPIPAAGDFVEHVEFGALKLAHEAR